MTGIAAGGAAEGFMASLNSANAAKFNQQKLQLEQQRMQMEQMRELTARADKHVADFTTLATNAATSFAEAHPGASEKEIALAIAPIKQQAMTIAQSAGRDPNEIDASFTAIVTTARSSLEATRQEVNAKRDPTETALRQSETDKNNAMARAYGGGKGGNPDLDNKTSEPQKVLDGLANQSGLQPDELDVEARSWLAGNKSIMQNRGRGVQGSNKMDAIRAWATYILKHEQGLTSEQAAEQINKNSIAFGAKETAAKAAAKTGATRAAALDLILEVAGPAADAAIKASNDLPRGSWVPVNSAIQMAQKAGSNPNLKVFAQKNLQLAEQWAKAMNPGGVMRNDDRNLALSILSTADSPETYATVARSVKASIGLERSAALSYLKNLGLLVPENALKDEGEGDVSKMSDDQIRDKLKAFGLTLTGGK